MEVKMTEGFKKDCKRIGLGGPYKPTLWENIWWPIEGFLEKIFRDIPNETKWFYQRGKRGYADCDLWGLDSYLSEWLPKALRELRDIAHGYPSHKGMTYKKWKKTLTKMANKIDAGRKIVEWDWKTKKGYAKLEKELKEGLKLFSKYFLNLWD